MKETKVVGMSLKLMGQYAGNNGHGSYGRKRCRKQIISYRNDLSRQTRVPKHDFQKRVWNHNDTCMVMSADFRLQHLG